MLATAGANVAEVVLAKETFDAGDFGYGLLVGVTGIGLALGSCSPAHSWSTGRSRRSMRPRSASSPSGWSERRPRRTSGSPPSRWRWPAPATAPRSSATRSSSSGARRTSSAAARSRCSWLQLRRARNRDDRRRAAHGRARPEDRLGHRRRPRGVAALVGLLLARGVAMGARPAEAPAAEPEAVETARL